MVGVYGRENAFLCDGSSEAQPAGHTRFTNAARDRHGREAGPTPGVRSLTTMTSLTRFISWMVAIGTGGAAANAWRAIEERAQVEAALDALSTRMNTARASDAQSGDAPSGDAQSGDAQSGDRAPSRAA
jgi:hypothetical protein